MLVASVFYGGRISAAPSAATQAQQDRASHESVSKLSVLGPVIVEVENSAADEERVKEVMTEVITNSNANNLRACYLQGLELEQDKLAEQLLDAGMHGAFFKYPTMGGDVELEVLKKVLQIFTRARVGIVVNATSAAQVNEIIANYRSCAVHFYFNVEQPLLEQVVAAAKSSIEKTTSAHDNVQVYIGLPKHSSAITATKIAASTSDRTIHAVFKAKPLREESGGEVGEGVDILSAYIAGVRSDRPDGLYPTVVCDEHGVCLGLVYSNDVSICAAVFEKKGIYWSRSRGGLWRKGDSSGMHQELLSIDLDCDGDALRFTVIQHGSPPAFCHLLTRTCWGDVHGLQHLQAILQARLVSAPEGSYTKRLFTDKDLLQKKLVEEALELAEAEDHDDVAGEAADLMYFLMVRCVAAGVSLKDVEKKLDYRSLKVTRRPGNAKEWRTQAAAALLGTGSARLTGAGGAMPSAPPS